MKLLRYYSEMYQRKPHEEINCVFTVWCEWCAVNKARSHTFNAKEKVNY